MRPATCPAAAGHECMLLTLSTTHRPATDLGFLLHKHPDRAQQENLSFGTAHLFYLEAREDRCTFALLLEVDPVALVRGSGAGAGPLYQYVNESIKICGVTWPALRKASRVDVISNLVFGKPMRVQIQLRIVTDDDTVLSEDVIACFDKGDDQRERHLTTTLNG